MRQMGDLDSLSTTAIWAPSGRKATQSMCPGQCRSGRPVARLNSTISPSPYATILRLSGLKLAARRTGPETKRAIRRSFTSHTIRSMPERGTAAT